jgi:hypothetical protein
MRMLVVSESYQNCQNRVMSNQLMTEGGGGCDHRLTEYTEWPFSGLHFIKMEKFAQAGEGAGCTPTRFKYIYRHIQICSVRSN